MNPIVLDPQTTLALPLTGIKLIEASAGTGKTYTIGNLYLRHVLAGYGVGEILVVTFTNAATEELRGRIRARLYQTLQLLQDPPSGGDPFLDALRQRLAEESGQQAAIERLKLAVRSMDEAAIYTIHGFCQRALTDHAFNSGQSFDVNLSSDDSELWITALKDWWRRSAYELDPQDVTLLTDAVGTLDAFIRLQQPLRQAFEKTLLPQVDGGLPACFAAWRALVDEMRNIASEWQQRGAELQEILLTSKALKREKKGFYKEENLPAKFEILDDWFASDELQTLPDEFKMLAAATLEKNTKPSQLGKDPLLQAPFFVACQQVLDKRQKISEQLRSTALAESTAFAKQQVRQTKQQNQSMAFNDLLTLLHEALDGPQGPALAESLRQRFPAAMIDEFQDTDALQYGIFRRLYSDQPDCGLTMIGDPKQAIYSFRGGDIFTYMRAKADAVDSRYSLDTNWRSVPGLIEAVNAVFTFRADPFVYSEAIDYQPVRAATEAEKGASHRLLAEGGQAVAPLTLWRIPPDEKGKPPSKTQAQSDLVATTAAEIARLLSLAAHGEVTLGDRPLRPGDIAVLVRNNYEATDVRKALQLHGIAAVSVGRDKVFESTEATGLELLLQAVIQCNDRSHARNALASDLLGLSYNDMAQTAFDEARWLTWVDELRELNRLWRQRGFMSMFQALLQHLNIGRNIAALDNAERRLTNLLHLGELLQAASKTHPGMDALLSWYRQQMRDNADEEAELRLESDEALVNIVTIHKSKGLEYPLVFLPFLWACRAPKFRGELVAFHDEQKRAFLDAAVHADSLQLRLAEKERLAEDIRLAYVALTRAQAKVYLAWGHVATGGNRKCDSGSTALGYLLHPAQTPDDLTHGLPDAFGTGADLDADLTRLADITPCIELCDLPQASVDGSAVLSQTPPPPLAPASFEGAIASDWRVASFTALTRDIHQIHRGGSPRGEDPVLNFPAGSHVGSFLHLLLERLDFQADVETQVATLTKQLAPRFGLDPERHHDTLQQWMRDVVDTPLDTRGLCLRQLANGRRLNELVFDFAIGGVDIAALNTRLQAVANQPLAPIEIDDFRGMITGIIDLIFEHDGRFYIADYKSNFLGGALDDYTPAKLRQAVLDRRYDLQYLLYALALHRYLRQRLADYDYGTHFGGVYYLFLRGMRPASGPCFGIHFDLPDQALIDWLDRQLFAPEANFE
ncbi:MAG: exodeoxyribonuclease V subunit beta [Gammaproteobacteria bacterium]|nr:exodeoxyribonuclease V subunit beta [Gammaproteobacteria bacterium]MCF6364313.1 exodeoxyribonuclease V subunit beta [Gammaproteobacteria bacterium]